MWNRRRLPNFYSFCRFISRVFWIIEALLFFKLTVHGEGICLHVFAKIKKKHWIVLSFCNFRVYVACKTAMLCASCQARDFCLSFLHLSYRLSFKLKCWVVCPFAFRWRLWWIASAGNCPPPSIDRSNERPWEGQKHPQPASNRNHSHNPDHLVIPTNNLDQRYWTLHHFNGDALQSMYV